MKINEKAGISIVSLGVLISLWSVVFSTGIPQLGFWINLMGDDRLYSGSLISFTDNFYLHTKHILLACITLILYGLMIYLDIIKTPERIRSIFHESPSIH